MYVYIYKYIYIYICKWHLPHERVGTLAAAVGARVGLARLVEIRQPRAVEPVAGRVHPELAFVALDHIHIGVLAVDGHADGAVLARLDEAAAGLAHGVVGAPLLGLPGAAALALDALWALEGAVREAFQRRVEAADVASLVALFADGQTDLGAVMAADLARLALEAAPRGPRLWLALQIGVQAAEVETVAAALALEHVAADHRRRGRLGPWQRNSGAVSAHLRTFHLHRIRFRLHQNADARQLFHRRRLRAGFRNGSLSGRFSAGRVCIRFGVGCCRRAGCRVDTGSLAR